jgi:hypothetical protein
MIVVAVVAVAVLGVYGRAQDDSQAEPGYMSLFNGKDLTGWKVGKTGTEPLDGKTEAPGGRFKVSNSAIVAIGTTPANKKVVDLYTVREFDKDGTLKLEFRAAPEANSGLYIRGTQLQVRDYPTVGPYKELKSFKPGGWNQIEVKIKTQGGKCYAECTCNGEMLERALEIPAKGGIGVQSEFYELEYRKIRIQEQP